MNIQPLKDADFNLVEVKTTNECKPTPHCKKHGAMNKHTSDGIWRCVTIHGIEIVKIGNSIGLKEVDNLCKAGCQEIINYAL